MTKQERIREQVRAIRSRLALRRVWREVNLDSIAQYKCKTSFTILDAEDDYRILCMLDDIEKETRSKKA